jgi:hypothetical protein
MEVLAENRQVLRMIADHWPVADQDRAGAYVTFRAPLRPVQRPVPVEQPVPVQRPVPVQQPWVRGAGQAGTRHFQVAGRAT